MFFQKLFHAIVEKHANCSRDCALTCKSYQFIYLFSDEGTTYDFLCSPTWLVGTWHALPDQISAPSWSLYTPLKHTAHWSKICTLWILCRIFLPSPLPGTMVAHWIRSWLTLACSSRSDFSPFLNEVYSPQINCTETHCIGYKDWQVLVQFFVFPKYKRPFKKRCNTCNGGYHAMVEICSYCSFILFLEQYWLWTFKLGL